MPERDEAEKIAILASVPRMTDMMARVPAGFDQTMQLAAGTVLHAALLCTHCASTKACDEWSATHEEGEGSAPPEFCPNHGFISSLAPKSE